MTKTSNLKIEIIRKLEAFSLAKLSQVMAFVKRLDNDEERPKRLLSFAGRWKELDQDIFDDLTTNLHENRAKDIREF